MVSSTARQRLHTGAHLTCSTDKYCRFCIPYNCKRRKARLIAIYYHWWLLLTVIVTDAEFLHFPLSTNMYYNVLIDVLLYVKIEKSVLFSNVEQAFLLKMQYFANYYSLDRLVLEINILKLKKDLLVIYLTICYIIGCVMFGY